MKRKSIYLFAALATAAFSLSSCSNDESAESVNSPAELKITAEMYPAIDISTRAAYNLQGTTPASFTNIGIYVWYNGYKAAKTTAPSYAGYANDRVASYTDLGSGSGPYSLTPTTNPTMYFPIDNADVDVYLYAPYNSTAADANMMTPDFTVADDQSTDANYLASDFIYGMATADYDAASDPKIAKVTMYHALSKIILKVVPASGVSVSGLSELKLTGVKRTTIIRMANDPSAGMTVGSTNANHVDDAKTLTGNGTDVIVTNTSNFNATVASSNGVAAIIPPQALTSLGVSCTIDNKTATKTLSGLTYNNGTNPSASLTNFLPGKVYTITLNIKTTGIEIRLISITDWDPGNGTAGSELDLDTWS